MATTLTLGVEEELHLLDLQTWQLAPRAPQLLSRLPAASFSAELQRTTVETNTQVCQSLTDLRADITSLRRQLVAEAATDGLGVAAVGTAAISSAADFELTASGRFGRMHEEYRQLVDEQLICGTQVHVGVDDPDAAVDVTQRVSRDLPLLLALSASSPYWYGADTGYSSIRTIIWQRWPTSGTTGSLSSAADYSNLVADLIATGVIADAKMAYFDVRPSSHVPTVELRVCDACPLVDDAILIAGLFRALVLSALQARERGEPIAVVAPPLHRAAMWRAARSGLSGELLDDSPHPRPIPAADAVRGLLSRLRPQLEELEDFDEVSELAEATLARGNSADRQRAAWAERGKLSDVAELVVGETHGVLPQPVTVPMSTHRYPVRAGDEAIRAGGAPRPAYSAVLRSLDAMTDSDRLARAAARDKWALAAGMTFGVAGEHKPFNVDVIPRIVPAHEWAMLSAGLIQRARALEAFLQDAYGPAKLVQDGLVAPANLHGAAGWRPEASTLPATAVRAPIMGFDLVRNELGDWRVLEDNVRVPSGAGYGLAVRALMDEVMADVPRPAGLLDPATAPPLLRTVLAECASAVTTRADPTIGLLSDGAGNSAWFEHRLLAREAGLLLLQPQDLDVEGSAVYAQVDGQRQRIDLLYLRLDVELTDLVDNAQRPIGAAVMAAAADGGVALANAPGNGIADDKAMYCHVPDLIGYYLAERPLLETVPTYRCADPQERHLVLERVGELVTKPIDGYGGEGVLIGPVASAAQVQSRRAAITAEPARWVAQEVVRLSSHPTMQGTSLSPRHVDLRAFVYLSGTGVDQVHVADLALTRVAPAGSMVVNSSRGGGAKDTWILAQDAPDASATMP